MIFTPSNHLSSDDWRLIRELYEASFPIEERRDWALVQRPQRSEFALYKMSDEAHSFIGFATLWHLPSCLYVEHLAIRADLRGGGLGTAVVQALLQESDSERPLLLEVEPAEAGELAHRRIAFYERSGLQLLPYDYIQPAYSDDLPEVVLRLMCSRWLEEHSCRQLIGDLYRVVYARSTDARRDVHEGKV